VKRLEKISRKSEEFKKIGMQEEVILQVCLNRLKTFEEKSIFLKKII
jgi:phage tail tube protein FII